MKLEQQVTSLALSKRLKELGVKQESLYYWQQIGIRKGTLVQNRNTGHFDTNEVTDWYAAFTVAELGEGIRNSNLDISFNFMTDCAGNGWRTWLADAEDSEFPFTFDEQSTFFEKNEAEARGLMLAYLIENGLLTL